MFKTDDWGRQKLRTHLVVTKVILSPRTERRQGVKNQPFSARWPYKIPDLILSSGTDRSAQTANLGIHTYITYITYHQLHHDHDAHYVRGS